MALSSAGAQAKTFCSRVGTKNAENLFGLIQSLIWRALPFDLVVSFVDHVCARLTLDAHVFATDNSDKNVIVLKFSVLINPFHRFSQSKIVRRIFSRQSFIELILLRWKIVSLAGDVLPREIILRYPLTIFLALK